MAVNGVDSFANQVFLNPASSAMTQSALNTSKAENTKKTKKSKFSSMIDRQREVDSLEADGLPSELADMEEEEAVIFLKDAADIAADKLRESMLPENFKEYRKKVSQFMKYIARNNFEISKKEKRDFRTGKVTARVQINIINQKLDDMARWLLDSHRDTLKLLAKVDEIQGMIIDLMAK